MKIGDLVIVKDALGYNAYMQNLVGHIGVIVKYEICIGVAKVHISGKTRSIRVSDLEVIHENR